MPPVSGFGSSVGVNLLVILRLSSTQAPIYYISLYRYIDVFLIYTYVHVCVYLYKNTYI